MRFDENLDLGGRVIFHWFHRGMSLRGVIVPVRPMITIFFGMGRKRFGFNPVEWMM